MDNDINEFLRKISQIESSGGSNFEHKEIKSGPQKGQTAIGTYGLLPNTVDEVVARSKDPELKELSDMTPKQQKIYLESNPDKEQLVAKHLAEYVLDKQGGDQEKAAYSWLYGHNLSPKAIEKRDYKDEPYVQKFNKISEAMKLPTKSQKYTPRPGETAPPLDIGGTPEGDKVQHYLEDDNIKDMMDKHYTEQKDNTSKALELASNNLINNKPITNEMPVVEQTPITNTKPLPQSVFNKVQNYLNPKAIKPQDFSIKQDPMEVLKSIRDSSNAAITPNIDSLTPEQILKLRGN